MLKPYIFHTNLSHFIVEDFADVDGDKLMTSKVAKVTVKYLCIFGADVDGSDVVDDVLDCPPIDRLTVAAGHVTAK